jgi:predicted MPP superfamily phosphohydrolase
MFKPLRALQSAHGTFAVLGNWDYKVGAVTVRRAVESHKTEVLTNESVVLGPPEAPFRLVGLDDLKYGTPDWEKALSEAQPGETLVVLAHNPDAASEAEVRGLPLVIAGHTHGGQIRLPFIGAVPPLPTKLGRRYDKGVLQLGPVTLFITPGVGESGPRARFFQPPEVSILKLTY